MVKVLIDTSVLIEFSRTGEGLFEELLLAADESELDLITSSIVMYEFWSGKSMKKREVEQIAGKLFADLTLVGVGERVAKIAGELQREGKVEGNDALIAATALEEGAELATLNARDFERVERLKLWERSD